MGVRTKVVIIQSYRSTTKKTRIMLSTDGKAKSLYTQVRLPSKRGAILSPVLALCPETRDATNAAIGRYS
jgi:hypothetical protein